MCHYENQKSINYEINKGIVFEGAIYIFKVLM